MYCDFSAVTIFPAKTTAYYREKKRTTGGVVKETAALGGQVSDTNMKLVGGARFELATNGLKEQNYFFTRL